MFVVHTTVPLDPDHRDDALELVDDLTAAARDLPGVVRYRPAVSLEEDYTLQFFEQYEDGAAVAAKEGLPEYEAFATALPDLTDGRIETVQAELDEAPAAVQFDAEDAVPE
ncbi:putative quinol monooxygenase [Halobacterium zhouii]|uniref:putative quinol monooxygenase n=1 Tax=Halobacterium zhouii TaxID=2902624 RepID=UPI001E30A5A9|nr:antibiotic biosynthesis monooxygenase [Halobacterium zhouii]